MNMQTNITPRTGGGNFDYLTPEITALDIAVEKGFASTGLVEDVTYDNSWQDANPE